MDPRIVFTTPWFDLLAKYPLGYSEPHYSIRTRDYVSIVAVTPERKLVLVRQYRPAVDTTTLELPSGHVEPEDTPEHSARKELLEETGYVAEEFELLGHLSPDTGRMGNRMWCYFAGDAVPTADAGYVTEPGICVVLYGGSVADLMAEGDLDSALNAAALLLAVLRDRLSP
jgi:ADP-ribose pyrophosphatase